MLGVVFFFKQKTAYEMLRSLVGSERCIRDGSKCAGGRPHVWGAPNAWEGWAQMRGGAANVRREVEMLGDGIQMRGVVHMHRGCLLDEPDAADDLLCVIFRVLSIICTNKTHSLLQLVYVHIRIHQ